LVQHVVSAAEVYVSPDAYEWIGHLPGNNPVGKPAEELDSSNVVSAQEVNPTAFENLLV
jgi:hypothetical protein